MEMLTVSEILHKLKAEGYTVDFNLQDNCLICHGNSLELHPDEFAVDAVYRFEGASDPDDEAVVYAISSSKHQVKGTLVNAYGIYSDNLTADLVKALKEPAGSEAKEPASVPHFANERVLDAPILTMDLAALINQIKQEQAWASTDRTSHTMYKNDGMRMMLMGLHAGAELKKHTAPGIISVQVLEGNIEFSTENETVHLSKDQLLTLQAGVPHRVVALEESFFLLTMALTTAGKS
ncbi:cupin domain-containing protein [Rufibacter immobilis]